MAKKKRNQQSASKRRAAAPPMQQSQPTGRLASHRPVYERILFILALLGGLTAIHLNIWYGAQTAAPDDPICGIGFDCEAVLASDPAPLGISSSVWGLLFYLAIAGVCAAIVFGPAPRRVLLKKVRIGLVGFGLLYSWFLTGYQFFGLSDRCILCLISASIVTLMAMVLVLYLTGAIQLDRGRRDPAALKREYQLFGGVAILMLLFAGGDFAYFSSLDLPVASATTALPAVDEGPVDVRLCRFDPNMPTFSNVDMLVDDYDPIVGNPEAPLTLIEFIDPNCPHCATAHPIVKAAARKYPDQLRVVYKPIAIVGSATHSIEEVTALYLAAEAGKFEEMLDLQFVNQSPRTGLSADQLGGFAEQLGMDRREFSDHIAAGRFSERIRRTRRIFNDMGFRGVPALMLEGRVIEGRSRSVGCISHFIDQELQAQGLMDPEVPAEDADTATEATPAEEG